MGVYCVVNIILECDNCHKMIGELNTSRDDVPVYARSVMTCQECLDKGVEHPSGSSDKGTVEFVDQAIEEANSGKRGDEK